MKSLNPDSNRVRLPRREFLKNAVLVASGAAIGPPSIASAAESGTASAKRGYPYHGRPDNYSEFRVIEPGRVIRTIETFNQGMFAIVRVTTADGQEGYGQIATFETEISVMTLHRKIAPLVLGKDPANIDSIVDHCIDANHKFPWSFVCRALGGVDTAIWDLYGRIKQKPVAELLGGKVRPLPAYGSSMSRTISPEAEAARLVKLRDTQGFRGFKIRVAKENGHDVDAAPGRSEKIIPTVRKALGAAVALKADANSGFTPPRAIAIGRILEDHGFNHYEEPCPYWELEWTAEVAAALKVPVAGGEQDNDVAQWRRMIRMNAVDIVQPDVLYLGGITRAWRVGLLAGLAGKPVVPHSANHSMVTLFTLHLLAATPNAGPMMEWSIEDTGMNQQAAGLFSPSPFVKDGQAHFEPGPGWGVKINPEWLKNAAYQKSESQA
jgi:L-alanine-DL-glutamate epimerase-like enolase superfamily enzyme